MTLIATAISQYGIVQAADPKLTAHPDRVVAGRRVFRLDSLNAVLSVTGVNQLAGEVLDEWMVKTIAGFESTEHDPSLGAFVAQLQDRLSRLRDPLHPRAIHVAGYVTDGAHVHPEVYYVRNIRGRAADGGYGRAGRKFSVSEEFWSRDFRSEETQDIFRGGGARMYLDGFPEKRVAYMVLHERIHQFYGQVWASSSKMFRTPSSLQDIASLVELDMRIAAMFLVNGAGHSRRLGDTLQVEVVRAPTNAIGVS